MTKLPGLNHCGSWAPRGQHAG